MTGESSFKHLSWQDQLRCAFKSQKDFEGVFDLSLKEKEAFKRGQDIFNIQATPYYISLADRKDPQDPIRKMILPHLAETLNFDKSQKDPLAENLHSPCSRLIHRYSDRVLFLVTDFCGIYCRYCTRKHFTGGERAFPKKNEYRDALNYISENKNIKEVILSGGDPLTLSNQKLLKIVSDIESIEHVDLIRIGSRMPAACPMRLDEGLLQIFKRKKPIVLMTHFNHHKELSEYTRSKLRFFADSGVQIFNQMVLLNGINNAASLVYRLSRELIQSKVFPYYMFQCDPSLGSHHLQTSIEESLQIQKELYGFASGLSMPMYSVDIPSGGGKAYLTPDFITKKTPKKVRFKGFDGVEEDYINPPKENFKKPKIDKETEKIWNSLKSF